jgi:hypothetical protein
MKGRVFLAILAVGLGFSAVRPGMADSSNQPPAGLLGNMQQEGWRLVAPGVLQRNLENNKVETLGFGAEGLRFKLDEMKEHYAFLRAEYERQPTQDLRRAIRAHRAEILRTAAALENAKSTGEMGSLNEKTAGGIDCTIKYGVHVNAFHLTGGSPGVGATTDAYFNSNCGHTGEVYAHSYSKATGADNVIRTATHSDPANQVPRYGGNVTAATSDTVVGVRDCHSYSYASVMSYDLGITYEQSVENWSCPSTPTVTAYVDYGYVQLYGWDCQTVTWTASVSGGTSPYSYAWYRGGSYVGSGSSYSEMFCGGNYSSSYGADATVTATDSFSQSGSASASTWIYTYTTNPGCTGRFCQCDPQYELCPQQPLD